MTLPGVIHPKRFVINEITLEVIAPEKLTDSQAALAAKIFYRSRRFTRRDRGKLFQVLLTSADLPG